MLLLAEGKLDDRRRAVQGPLAPLRQSLAAELEPWLDRALFVPREKALLSRAGGRCARDGTALEFDPASRDAHRCPHCDTTYSGPDHYRAWITWYQLWLAERAVHGALLHALSGDPRHAAFARQVLRSVADAYLAYPNRDNVLGPTRPFFSTYLESIWLLQVCVATDLLADTATSAMVRDRIIEPSRALISEFDEGASNRQVWNNAAMLAAALQLGDAAHADAIVHGEHGVIAHLQSGLLDDGTWFEGDNYHQFAIRGLWYAVVMCEANGLGLPPRAIDAFDRGVAGTFLAALPDFTFPSRKDSQYAVSFRQWRFAELAELGMARRPSAGLIDVLARCYELDHDVRDTGRARSAADAERNVPSCRLTRADLGWRALLHAVPELPALERQPSRSVLLAGQGLAIFRRPGDVYAGFDYGQSGAGHGHPDRLNLLLSQGAVRWLDDMGTGSYVDPSLHWFRSTLAHNAPIVDGRSQPATQGHLVAWDERGDFGWAEARVELGRTTLRRTIVVSPSYLLDELTWSAEGEVRVELPWHLDADPDGAFTPCVVDGGDGLEDGFRFLRNGATRALRAGEQWRVRVHRDGRELTATMVSDGDATILRAVAPGQPTSVERRFYIVRARGASGRFRAVLAWTPGVTIRFDAGSIDVTVGGVHHRHARSATGWQVEAPGSDPHRVNLTGLVPAPLRAASVRGVEPAGALRRHDVPDGFWSALDPRVRKGAFTMELAERNYRRSEERWSEAGAPTATIAMLAGARSLAIFADVRAVNQRFVTGDGHNAFDNEHPDTLGAGMQLYVEFAGSRGAWMLVPEQAGRVRVRPLAGSVLAQPVVGWRKTDRGWEIRTDLELPPTCGQVKLDIVINEADASRERRRGQLVTADVQGESVYLRGDREASGHSLVLTIAP